MSDVAEPDLRSLAGDLAERRADALRMGGAEQVARQHGLGKLTVRERLDLLLDPGTFHETGLFAGAVDSPQSQGRRTPADGCVTGVGEVDGRRVTVIAYDFTVLAGSIGMHGERKATRAREFALRHGTPVVYLLDSAGARVNESVGAAFAGAGDLFREITQMSGVVPQVAAMLGPCSAGTAYIPALCDFVPMVRGTSSMALAGVHLVRAATGEEVTEEEMGGSAVHNKVSGVADREAADDAACLGLVRSYLSYFPSRYGEASPRRDAEAPDRRSEELYDIVPVNPRRAYDMRKVISAVVDEGSFFPMKPDWARSVITGLARFAGRPAGIVANQPLIQAGSLDVNSADKAARFINLCDSFDIPLVFLVDVPGFVVGKAVEHAGIIRHGAKMLWNVSAATVPKVTVVLRKAYGAGYFVMAGRAFESDYLVSWPTGEFSVMGPEGAVNILFRKQLAAAPDDGERERLRAELLSTVRAQIDPYLSARMALVDDIIDPADTRRHIVHGLQVAERKRLLRPVRKRGVVPV